MTISYFSSIDELISNTLSNGLDVSEGSFTSSSTQQPDGLVYPSQGGHIHSLSSHGTSSTDTGGVFSGSRVNDSSDQDLKWVLMTKQNCIRDKYE